MIAPRRGTFRHAPDTTVARMPPSTSLLNALPRARGAPGKAAHADMTASMHTAPQRRPAMPCPEGGVGLCPIPHLKPVTPMHPTAVYRAMGVRGEERRKNGGSNM
jgi:hypothetical protein